MANHRIPRAAEPIETLAALADDGRTARLRVYRHTRAGHSLPDFYVVQYLLTPAGRVDRSTRVTTQFTGTRAAQRLEAAMAQSRALFAARKGPAPT